MVCAPPASAVNVWLQWGNPQFESDGSDTCGTSTTPETGLDLAHIYARREPQGDTLKLGVKSVSGREGLRDSVLTDIDPSVHYLTYWVRFSDDAGNMGCPSNSYLAAVPMQVANQPDSSGLRAWYWDNRDLAGTPFGSRIDSMIAFDWDFGAPMPGMGVETFSARWSGFLLTTVAGTYTFRVRVEDAFRMWLDDVDGSPMYNDWSVQDEHDRTFAVPLPMNTWVPFKMEYFANNGDAALKVYWRTPGGLEELIQPSRWRH